jgi:predicted Zn-dependent peptidase
MNLREKHGYTYGVSSGFAMRRQAGPFFVSTAVQTEVTAAALTEIMREIDGIRAAPVDPRELDDARNYLAGVFPLRLQTTEGVASRLAELALHELPPDYFDDYRDRALAVDSDAVHRVARTYIRPEEMATVIVGDSERIRASIEALEVASVQVVDVGELP